MPQNVEDTHYAAPNEPNAGRYSLRRKILLGFFSVLALLVVVWAWSIFALWQLGNAGEQVLEENFRSILAAESMIDVLERQNSGVAGVVGRGGGRFRPVSQRRSRILAVVGGAKDNITVEGETETLSTLDEEYAVFLRAAADLRSAMISGDAAPQTPSTSSGCCPAMNKRAPTPSACAS